MVDEYDGDDDVDVACRQLQDHGIFCVVKSNRYNDKVVKRRFDVRHPVIIS